MQKGREVVFGGSGGGGGDGGGGGGWGALVFTKLKNPRGLRRDFKKK